MACGGPTRFLTQKGVDKLLKLVSKLSAKGSGEGTPPHCVAQNFSSAGWTSCSFSHKIYPFLIKASTLSSSTSKSTFSTFSKSKLFKPILQQSRNLRQKPSRKSAEEQLQTSKQIPHKFNNMDRLNYVFKPFAFTAFVGGVSIIGCTIWQYEEYRKSVVNGRFSLSGLREAVFGGGETSRTSNSGNQLFDKVEDWWHGLSPGEKIFWPICAINSLVWLAWRVPGWAPTMVTYFSATPVGRKICLPMLLSTFSHYSFLHLCANMFVLHSFIPAAAQILGKEQFVAMYLTSGTVASLGSHLHKLFIGNATPSLGASGAIMGILGLVCTRMPDIQLGIIFLPGVQFTADTALRCILAVDCAGVLLGWRFMDHAAHLSGCLFGIAFSHWGNQTFWAFRDYVMTQWHKFRMS